MAASREVARFIADVIETAGGPQLVTLDLEKLGYVGRDGPYSEQAVRTWRAGARTPGSDLLFALARYYALSLDEYAFGRSLKATLTTAIRDSEQERNALRETLRDLVEADESYDVEAAAIWPTSRPGSSGQRRFDAMRRAREMLP